MRIQQFRGKYYSLEEPTLNGNVSRTTPIFLVDLVGEAIAPKDAKGTDKSKVILDDELKSAPA